MRALMKGLWEADTWTLRGWLRAVAFAMFAVTIGYVAIGSGSRNGPAGGLGGSVVVLFLALAAQWLAERRGAGERERRRVEEWPNQLLSRPRWKQIAVLTIAVELAVTMLILGLSRRCDRSLSGCSSPCDGSTAFKLSSRRDQPEKKGRQLRPVEARPPGR